jgi:ParB-like chromosome segregation protein Spo0J
MAQIVNVGIGTIDANPFRLLGDYPYVERKLETLQRSYGDAGMWPGVIARKRGNRNQIAFGHHRVEAARRFGLESVALIIEDLSDEQMLQYMGRENMEDYNADFLVMLETWEAGLKFLARDRAQNPQPIDIAKLLGWIRSENRPGEVRSSDTANACHAAHSLIVGGHLSRDDVRGLATAAVREIVQRAQSNIEQLEKMARVAQRPVAETEQAKEIVGKAAARTADQFRRGEHGLGQKDLGGRVDLNAYRFAREAKKQSPLFTQFTERAIEAVARMLKEDATAEKLEEIAKFVSEVVTEEDRASLRKLDFGLGELGQRSTAWRKRLLPNKVAKLSPVAQLTEGR